MSIVAHTAGDVTVNEIMRYVEEYIEESRKEDSETVD